MTAEKQTMASPTTRLQQQAVAMVAKLLVVALLFVQTAGQPSPAPGGAPSGGPNQYFYYLPAPAPVPAPGSIPAPSPLVPCCGVFLGPNSGNFGEYEVQVDLSGVAPGKTGATPTTGVYTIKARVFVTPDWDGVTALLHSRAFDSDSATITSINPSTAFPSQYNKWETINATIDMGASTPYRVSIYFGYPMSNSNGYVYVSRLEFLDENGYNWIPNLGYVDCDIGFHEGAYQNEVDSYGNVGVQEGACEGGVVVANPDLSSCEFRCGGSVRTNCCVQRVHAKHV